MLLQSFKNAELVSSQKTGGNLDDYVVWDFYATICQVEYRLPCLIIRWFSCECEGIAERVIPMIKAQWLWRGGKTPPCVVRDRSRDEKLQTREWWHLLLSSEILSHQCLWLQT